MCVIFAILDASPGIESYWGMNADAAADWEKLHTWEMPFGRFKGRKLYELPAEYLCWFEQNGFPSGDLGRLLQIVLEAKRQGADHAFDILRK